MVLLSREALYERVWREPVRTVAEDFGLSDVGLRKVCSRADIPLPERGYWARLRSGKQVAAPNLPPRGPAMPHMVSVGAAEPYRSYWSRSIQNLEAELAEPPPEPPVFDEPIEDVRVRVAQRVGRVRFERNLASGHILIRDLLTEDEKRRKTRGEPSWGYSRPEPMFESGFERHRLRVLSSLFLALQKFAAPSMRGETGRELSLSVGVETVQFTLDHPNAKADRNGFWKTWPGTIDVLRLSIEGAGARVWLDTEEDRLEARLDEVVVQLIVAGELNYRARADASYERAVGRRREAQEELEKARAEVRRKAREARIAQESERRETLLGMAADLRAADDIRALVRRMSEAHVDAETEPARAWGRWALEVADRLDPTARLQFDRGGRGRLGEPEWPVPDDFATPQDELILPDHEFEREGGGC